jgi:hypothetical protein
VGHLNPHGSEVGDSVFAFANGILVPNEFDDNSSSEMYEIGQVVSVLNETDSLVFSIYKDIEVALLKLAPDSGLNKELVWPEPNPARWLKKLELSSWDMVLSVMAQLARYLHVHFLKAMPVPLRDLGALVSSRPVMKT